MGVSMDSAFGSGQLPSESATNCSKIEIDKYIAAGCLRISRPETKISIDAWQEFSQWQIISRFQSTDSYDAFQQLFSGQVAYNSHFQASIFELQKLQWIRMEFRYNDLAYGQVRVYVLPDDVGNSVINRAVPALRKAMLLLLNKLDTSTSTWNGRWSYDSPVRHVDPSLDADVATGDGPSLFQLFNTLPSPKPNPELVSNVHARDAMYKILGGSINELKTEMYAYQRRSAALMIQRESQPARLLDPRLRQMIDLRGNDWYCDADSGSCFREPRTYEAARGGICAETMGLGKTLICLGVIMSTRDVTSEIPVEYLVSTHPVREKTGSLSTMAAATLGRLAFPWKQDLAAWEAREGYRFDRCRDALAKHAGFYMLPSPGPRRKSRNPVVVAPRKILLTSTTIVVAPANLIQQWQHEIMKHTTGLNVLVMKAMCDALPPAEKLAEYDIILFSKQRFEKEAMFDINVNFNFSGSAFRQAFGHGGRFGQVSTGSESIYSSPLKDLHFKRLIVDEGHTFGNASGSSRTEAGAVVDFLQVSARWIVSGTPTKGLYGAEVGIHTSETTSREHTPSSSSATNSDDGVSSRNLSALLDLPASKMVSQTSRKELNLFHKQERKDIEKLGNIATSYLKARPWANRPEDNDFASWSHLIMQPRHGSKSRGNLDILRATLEGMIIRHRQEDIEVEVALPPLHQSHVLLEGSLSNNLSLNTFSMMMVANAVTSERKDADYFFHPRQRKNLQQLVSNLRQASFFWSGFEKDHIKNTIENAKNFLDEKKVPISSEDEALLLQAIEHGKHILNNRISRVISTFHEMPMQVNSDLTNDMRTAWSLTRESGNPTLMGATMVQAAQKFVESQLYKEDPTEGLLEAGQKVMHDARMGLREALPSRPKKRKLSGDMPGVRRIPAAAPALAGGVTIGSGSSPRKRARTAITTKSLIRNSNDTDLLIADSFEGEKDDGDNEHDDEGDASIQKQLGVQLKPKSALKQSSQPDISGTLDPSSPLATATIISTASSKLSYLMDRITVHSPNEKILIFYEADNIAYYIAQALECLGIKHLIYAKTLSSARRSQYVVTFNQSEIFRVLLMDVSQAAFGLDMSSASRVYFVNPVFSPQVEAQAVKRAHRIGQTKPVYVETLVLKGSIEEVILERRKELSTEEHNSCKSILDDSTMYDWIRNARFLDVGGSGGGDGGAGDEVEQMAMLETPKLLFGRGGVEASEGRTMDPDQDLILGDSPEGKGKGKGKAKIMLRFKVKPLVGEKVPDGQGEGVSEKAKGKRKVGFADVVDVDIEGAKETQKGSPGSGSGFGTPVREHATKKVRIAEG